MIKKYSCTVVLLLLLTMTASCNDETITSNQKSGKTDSASTTDKDVEAIESLLPSIPTHKNVEAIKKLYPYVDTWVVHEFNGTDFLFCQVIHPSYGSSVIEFHGWFFASHLNAWQHFITARTRNIGVAEIVFDDKKGLCTLRGLANNKFKNVDVVLVNLYLAE